MEAIDERDRLIRRRPEHPLKRRRLRTCPGEPAAAPATMRLAQWRGTSAAIAGRRRPGPATRQRLAQPPVRSSDVKVSPYAYIAPFFLLFAAFGLFPLIYTALGLAPPASSCQNPDDMNGSASTTTPGCFDDEYFWNALRNTFTIGVLSTVPQLLIALGLAHLLNYRLRGSTFFRDRDAACRTRPRWPRRRSSSRMLFGRDFGLDQLGARRWSASTPVDWENGTVDLADRRSRRSSIWRWTGYNALIYLAAMQAIPNDLYEAAAMDGAAPLAAVPPRDDPGAAADDHLHGHRVDDRRDAALRRAAAVRAARGVLPGGADHQYQTLGLLPVRAGLGQSSTSAGPRPSPGRCS